MDGLPRIDKERFIRQMQEEVREALSRVADAVNAGTDGDWVNTSEKPVREVMDELRRKAFEMAVQIKADANESAFSPSAGRSGTSFVSSGPQGQP